MKKWLTRVGKGIVVWSVLIIPLAVSANTIRIVTEHLPPYQFIGKDNHLTGFSVEIVQAMLKQANVDAPIEMLPWARAYEMALSQKNIMIFSMTRSKARQGQFKWVGDFLKQNYYFLSLNSRKDIKINNIQDVKRYVTGVSRDSYEYQLLTKYGFSHDKNMHVNVAQLPLVEMLFDGKIDLVFGSKITLLGLIKYVKRDTAAIRLAYQINESPGNISIAFSKQTDDVVVEKYQKAFNEIKANGELDKIIKKWLNLINEPL